jgi:hypothetical protein
MMASPTIFAALVGLAIVGAAVAAVVLIAMILHDWRKNQLW